MKYMSTRGGVKSLSFEDAVLMGLSVDGGLLVPERIPRVDEGTINAWKALGYRELAVEVIGLFSDMERSVLKSMIDKAYSSFDIKDVVSLKSFGNLYILELFHGPTLSFKDIALQFLGNLFEHILKKRGSRMNILVATSGDTGSAAIYGVKGKRGISIFVLFPHGKISPVQEIQITTVSDPNVHSIAIEGTFDDCQYIVKEIFSDLAFKERFGLGAVNSINWSRVVAQMVYYVWSYLRLLEMGVESVRFCVPTGNFGNILAGYIVKMMLPEGAIERMILATNENDILYRFVTRGDYSVGEVIPTISPSMDIQVASNFERYLFYLWDGDVERVRRAMEELKERGRITFSEADISRVSKDFVSERVSQDETLETIREFYQETGYILDPHTAVGVRASLKFLKRDGIRVVSLATAHPSKFPEAVKRAIGREPDTPERLRSLFSRKKRMIVLPASVEKVKEYVEKYAI